MTPLEKRYEKAKQTARELVDRYGYSVTDRELSGILRRVALYISSRNLARHSAVPGSQTPSFRADVLESLREDPVQLAAALTALRQTHFFGSNLIPGWRRPDMQGLVRMAFSPEPGQNMPRAVDFHGISTIYLREDHVSDLRSLARLIRTHLAGSPEKRETPVRRTGVFPFFSKSGQPRR